MIAALPTAEHAEVLVTYVAIVILPGIQATSSQQLLFLLVFPRWQCQPLGVLSYLT